MEKPKDNVGNELADKFDISILFEDNHIIVINKKASQITQGDKTGDEPLPEKIKTYLKLKYNKPGNVFCGVVHRLDRPTSGVLVFAKTSKALERLNKQFHDKITQKTYWAIVESKPRLESEKLVHFLRKNEKQNKSYASLDEKSDSKKAILTYTLSCSSEKYHLLEIELETGRHHQIRSQLAAISCVIKGDVKYGARRSNPDASICLHARKLSLIHPTSKEEMEFTAPVPNDNLWTWFEKKME